MITIGVCFESFRDPGLQLLSNPVLSLNSRFGICHRESLVGQHVSYGIERTDVEILCDLCVLVYYDSIKK